MSIWKRLAGAAAGLAEDAHMGGLGHFFHHDNDGNALHGLSKADLERIDEHGAVDAGQQREQEDRAEQRDEHVPAVSRDREEEQRDHTDESAERDQGTAGDPGFHR